VVGEYLRLIDGFVIDKEDEQLADDVRSLGIHVLTAPTVMRTLDDRVALARAVLNFAFVVREAIAMETIECAIESPCLPPPLRARPRCPAGERPGNPACADPARSAVSVNSLRTSRR
jgi:hypothetical protein